AGLTRLERIARPLRLDSRRETSVHGPGLTGDETGLLGGEEGDDAGDLLRPAQTSKRDLSGDLLFFLLGRFCATSGCGPGEQRRLDVAGGHAVDGHPRTAALLGKGPCEAVESRLRCRIHRAPLCPAQSR